MSNRDPQFDEYVLKIHGVLDRLDYYRLLGVAQNVTRAELKRAFYKIARKFHPDRNRDAEATVSSALYDIYKRLNEAYGVLGSDDRRKAYDENLKQGKVRLEQDVRLSMFSKKPEDRIKSRQARDFYVQAKEALDQGNLIQADLCIKLALGKESDSEEIIKLFKEIKEAKKGKKK